MIPVIIDISESVQEFSLLADESKALSQFVLDSVVTDFMETWMNEVDSSLHSTRKEYKAGMFQESPDDETVVVGLTARQSPLALMIEEGANPFDMKEGFEASKKKHQTKTGGWYLNIPFRWATSEAVAESATFSGRMPRPIEKLVKSLPGKTPLTLEMIEDKASAFAGIGQNKTTGYIHQNNIFEGLMRRQIGSGQAENRGSYMTFRRVGSNSDPKSWFHPGFEARNFMKNSLESMDISKVVDKAIDDFLSER